MATTVQQIIDRAKGRSVANTLPALTADAAQLIARCNDFQQALWRTVVQRSRTAFATSAQLTSTAAASGRAINLDAAPARVGRVLRVERASDALEFTRADLSSQDAEWGPRFLVERRLLREVQSSWGAGGGTVTVRVSYLERPAPLLAGAGLPQPVWIEDDYCFLLVNRMARDFARADVGREEAELQSLDAEYEEGVDAYIDNLQLLAGPRVVGTIVSDADDTDG